MSKYLTAVVTEEDIEAGAHRELVGGIWQDMGRLQLEWMKEIGLSPHHRLIDIGCGCLRGGLYFIDYLNRGNYHGLDVNVSLLRAGLVELRKAGLENKEPLLIPSDSFEFENYDYDYAIAFSLFTHLSVNSIVMCMTKLAKVMGRDGKLLATYFMAPQSQHFAPISHAPVGITTHYDKDPYHYSLEDMIRMANIGGMSASGRSGGRFKHARGQSVIEARVVNL